MASLSFLGGWLGKLRWLNKTAGERAAHGRCLRLEPIVERPLLSTWSATLMGCTPRQIRQYAKPYCEGRLSAEEIAALERCLRDDPQVMEFFVLYLEIRSRIAWNIRDRLGSGIREASASPGGERAAGRGRAGERRLPFRRSLFRRNLHRQARKEGPAHECEKASSRLVSTVRTNRSTSMSEKKI